MLNLMKMKLNANQKLIIMADIASSNEKKKMKLNTSKKLIITL